MTKIKSLLLASIVFGACSGQVIISDSAEFATLDTYSSHNDLTIGCECVDRDYCDFDAYKDYLPELGMGIARIQAGWAKCEKVKGQYSFEWLDNMVDGLLERGMEPWIELSYGNPVYEYGGTATLAGGWPRGDEAVGAWLAWVRELALRYKGKTHLWEVWNEPDMNLKHNFGGSAEEMVDLTVRTAEVLKSIDPEAEIAAFGLSKGRDSKNSIPLVRMLIERLQKEGREQLIEWLSFHSYHYRPEELKEDADSLQKIISAYSSPLKLWQGESGAPSKGYQGGALSKYDWTEVSQAKWDLRKMMFCHSLGMRTCCFTISDISYSADDFIKTKNLKGLLETDENRQVVRKKASYDAARRFATVYGLLDKREEGIYVSLNDSTACCCGFSDNETGRKSIVLWDAGSTPDNSEETSPADITVANSGIRHPVAMDIRTGRIVSLRYKRRGKNIYLSNVPFYDSPVIVADAKTLGI